MPAKRARAARTAACAVVEKLMTGSFLLIVLRFARPFENIRRIWLGEPPSNRLFLLKN